jgi:hypothetical protein
MNPKARRFLTQILQFLQAFVDQSNLMLFERFVGHRTQTVRSQKCITALFKVLATPLALQEDAPCAGRHINACSRVDDIPELLLCAQRVKARLFGNLAKQ